MTKEDTSGTHYDCGSCKYKENSLFKEPCMSCRIDYERDDKKPTRYEPKACGMDISDCEACQINV